MRRWRRVRRPRPVGLLPIGQSKPRQVGVCGSCGGGVWFLPDAAHAACECGDCKLPRRFLRYGEAS